jgi:hypothetical protein
MRFVKKCQNYRGDITNKKDIISNSFMKYESLSPHSSSRSTCLVHRKITRLVLMTSNKQINLNPELKGIEKKNQP